MLSSSYNHTVLIVDDEPDILQILSYTLEKEGYIVFTAENGEEGVQRTKNLRPSLILMDIMMPRMDGIEACQTIREDRVLPQPIIAFLTSRAEDYSQIAGFDAGADDYITKPIRPRLLVSKVKSLLRRTVDRGQQIHSSLIINREKFLAELNGEEIQLPKKEFQLLEFLMRQPGKVYTREQLLAFVWGDDTVVGERTIDVHIRKLREKLGIDYIRTIKGVGYTYNER